VESSVLLAYADRFSVEPGETLSVMVSTSAPSYRAHVVRLVHGDINPSGPGYRHIRISSESERTYPGRLQSTVAGSCVQVPLDRQLEMIALNVTTLTLLTRRLVPGMRNRRRGGVLNVGSTAGFQPGPFMAVYYATKAYVVSFTEALAEELSGSGVRVSCLAPGPTETGFAAEAGATDAGLFRGEVMTVDEVAQIGYEGWKIGKVLIVPGRRNRLRALAVRLLPRTSVVKAARRLNE